MMCPAVDTSAFRTRRDTSAVHAPAHTHTRNSSTHPARRCRATRPERAVSCTHCGPALIVWLAAGVVVDGSDPLKCTSDATNTSAPRATRPRSAPRATRPQCAPRAARPHSAPDATNTCAIRNPHPARRASPHARVVALFDTSRPGGVARHGLAGCGGRARRGRAVSCIHCDSAREHFNGGGVRERWQPPAQVQAHLPAQVHTRRGAPGHTPKSSHRHTSRPGGVARHGLAGCGAGERRGRAVSRDCDSAPVRSYATATPRVNT